MGASRDGTIYFEKRTTEMIPEVARARSALCAPGRQRMGERRSRGSSLVARRDQPLIAVPAERDGDEGVYYFVDDDAADRVLGQEASPAAIKLAGVWSDLDADEMLDALERMRRETPRPHQSGRSDRR